LPVLAEAAVVVSSTPPIARGAAAAAKMVRIRMVIPYSIGEPGLSQSLMD